ncbi:UNVERIFIED_CONTAM: hypothetical protein Sradi_0874800 [Sesamum radiatum]|uniref:Uncharacterized protein n=1 Tax=Sesamum radiatum TaxID=300843 RepID=A0AAW2V0X6_SESRA
MGCTGTTSDTPSPAQRHYMRLQDARALSAFLGQHIANPTGPPAFLVLEVENFLLVGLQQQDHVQARQVASQEVPAEAVWRRPQPVGRPLWLAEEIWRQLLEFWACPEF